MIFTTCSVARANAIPIQVTLIPHVAVAVTLLSMSTNAVSCTLGLSEHSAWYDATLHDTCMLFVQLKVYTVEYHLSGRHLSEHVGYPTVGSTK